MPDSDDNERRVYLRPLVRLTKNPDGTWHVDFDVSDSCDGEFMEPFGTERWNDFSEEACNAFDEWVKSQPILKDGADIPSHYIPEEPV